MLSENPKLRERYFIEKLITRVYNRLYHGCWDVPSKQKRLDVDVATPFYVAVLPVALHALLLNWEPVERFDEGAATPSFINITPDLDLGWLLLSC